METNSGGSRERRLAEEIVKLEQENARLRAALQALTSAVFCNDCRNSARAALAGEKKDE